MVWRCVVYKKNSKIHSVHFWWKPYNQAYSQARCHTNCVIWQYDTFAYCLLPGRIHWLRNGYLSNMVIDQIQQLYCPIMMLDPVAITIKIAVFRRHCVEKQIRCWSATEARHIIGFWSKNSICDIGLVRLIYFSAQVGPTDDITMDKLAIVFMVVICSSLGKYMQHTTMYRSVATSFVSVGISCPCFLVK